MTAIYRDSSADKRRIYDEGHISTSNKYNTLSKLDKRSEDTQLVWITEKSQLGDDPLKLVNGYNKRELSDEAQGVTAGEAGGYLVGVFIIIIGFTISIVIASILCRRWYEKNFSREPVRFGDYQIKGPKVKSDKWEVSNSPNPLEIKVEIFEKIERDDTTIVGVPSPTFPSMKDRHSLSTTHSSVSEDSLVKYFYAWNQKGDSTTSLSLRIPPKSHNQNATDHQTTHSSVSEDSLVKPFYTLNENGDSTSSVSLRIPPRSHNKNATDQRTPLKIANVQLEPISSMNLGRSSLSPLDNTDPKRSFLLLSSSGYDGQSWLYEDAFNGEYHDVNQNAESERRSFGNSREYSKGGKFTNRLTFGVYRQG